MTEGQSLTVKGDNRTGKTTLIDSFSWVLFGKDSQGRTEQSFGIKPTDENGQEIPGLAPTVECELDVGGQRITFKRVYQEKYVKERFSGHETKLYIDDVPVDRAKDFDERIAEIIDQEKFKLLTNPTHFLNLHWEKQRKFLMDTFGVITDEEMAKHITIKGVLEKHGVEDGKKLLKDKRKTVKKDKDGIPAKIEELMLLSGKLVEIDADATKKMVAELTEQMKAKQKELAMVESGSAVAEKNKQITEIDAEVLKLKNKHVEFWQKELNNLRGLESEKEAEKTGVNSNIERWQERITKAQEDITELEQQMADLRDEWHEVNNLEFAFEEMDVCPTCDQLVSSDKREEAKKKALAEHNLTKSRRLEATTVKGQAYKAQVKTLKQDIEVSKKELNPLLEQQKSLVHLLGKIQIERQHASQMLDAKDNVPGVDLKLKKKAEIQAEIEQLQKDIQPTVDKIQEEIDGIQSEIDSHNDTLTQIKLYEGNQKRIKELKAEEKKLAKELELIDGELDLIERYTRTKVELAEKRINSNFKFVQWKMFEQQVNGETKAVCQALVNGIAYQKGLNTEARINAGLDVINVFGNFYGIVAPVFVDNAEAVTKLLPTNTQIIKLFKPEIRTKTDAKRYSKLVVEIDEVEKVSKEVS